MRAQQHPPPPQQSTDMLHFLVVMMGMRCICDSVPLDHAIWAVYELRCGRIKPCYVAQPLMNGTPGSRS
jgi:hypothetical protein